MIPFEEALETVLRHAPSGTVQGVALEQAAGRVLAKDIRSRIDIPPFDKSAMDGYALRSCDTEHAPVRLRPIGTLAAGSFYRKRVGRNECVRIMTGSPLPNGADGVIPIEDIEVAPGSGEVLVPRSVKAGANVCAQGEDIRHGTTVLKRGTPIGPAQISVLASVGIGRVAVYTKPRVAVLNTGSELVQPGKKLGRGKIYDSNGYTLRASLSALGITSVNLGRTRDTEQALDAAIARGLQNDVLVISGGVSVGDYDLVPRVLAAQGVTGIFHKIAIKPGKPFFFGRRGETLVFGLPGNPVAGFVGFLLLVKPALRKMMGDDRVVMMQKGFLKTEVTQRPIGRKHFVPARLEIENGRLSVTPVQGYHGSADVRSLALANGFFIVEKAVARLRKNSTVGCFRYAD